MIKKDKKIKKTRKLKGLVAKIVINPDFLNALNLPKDSLEMISMRTLTRKKVIYSP